MSAQPISTQRLVAYSAALAVGIGLVLKINGAYPFTSSRKIIPSPRTTLLPKLSTSQTASLGYPPDALPGSRDVKTPHGYMRVYEWGPVEGRKVVMVHGDATAAPLFGRIAKELVNAGCRVLCFDLYGRGYSDTPSGVRHTARLYSQQINHAISSSPIDWTSSTDGVPVQFSLIGFSLGGAISLDYFATNPKAIESIVLLGPAGLLRSLPEEYTSIWFHYPAFVSKATMRRLVGLMLGVNPNAHPIEDADKPEGFTPARALQFQIDHHQGHVESMQSTVQNGPIQRQDKIYSTACDIITKGLIEDPTGKSKVPMYGGKILVICGRDDDVVPPAHTEEDLEKYLGDRKYFDLKSVPGGHGFPWAEGTTVGQYIVDFWEVKEG